MHAPSDRARSRAKRMRKRPTYAEAAFWELVRDRRLSGLKFLRQASMGELTADFLCREHRLVVELDGGIHALRELKDAERDALLASWGYRVLRFHNAEVFNETERVLDAIRSACGLPMAFPESSGLTPRR